MKMRILAALCAFAVTAPATAQEYDAAMQAFVEGNVRSWVNDPLIVEAIKAQNLETGDLSQAEIDAMDQAWRSEVGGSDTPTVTPVLANPVSDYLRARANESEGVITEIFVMDAKGLNVAASSATSDYWQGDEDKFTETYNKGADAVHISEVEFDESSQTYQGQVSMPVVDPASGEAIGAITIGLDAEVLF